jgi:dipeptidyl aminopeptidase/acylaminoacyl peptidase
LNTPPELCTATLNGGAEVQLTKLNEAVLAHWPKFITEPFSFQSTDGTRIEAWFMASQTSQRRPLPTVLFIHGGPYIATGYAFRYDFLLLASHGIGVLFANFRGSAGYGEAFARAIMGNWGECGYPDHLSATEAAIARGLADRERLGVWGPSHGGFATCWIVGHTDRFKAAVAEAAVTNFETVYYLTDAPEGFRRELGGLPHETPDAYRARSPLTYAHRCTTPTLLIHGEQDLRCPISEAEQFYRALKDSGCIVELVRIPACSHMGDSLGPLSARRAQNEALLSWFQRHL